MENHELHEIATARRNRKSALRKVFAGALVAAAVGSGAVLATSGPASAAAYETTVIGHKSDQCKTIIKEHHWYGDIEVQRIYHNCFGGQTNGDETTYII